VFPNGKQTDIGVFEYTNLFLKDRDFAEEETMLAVYPNPSTGISMSPLKQLMQILKQRLNCAHQPSGLLTS